MPNHPPQCCVASCDEQASVIDQCATSTLKISLPYCRTHFELWSNPCTLGKDVESIDFTRVDFAPAATPT